MANILFILSTALALQNCISAAPNPEDRSIDAIEESSRSEPADSTKNFEPYSATEAEVIDDKDLQGQRQKRFYDYYDTNFPHYVPYNPGYIKRDDSQYTVVPGALNIMLQILRGVQTVLSLTRQQALSPSIAHYPVPSFIPFYYIQRDDCDCTPATAPSNGEESDNDAHPTQTTTSHAVPDTTTQAISPANEPGPLPTDDTNNSTLDFPNRSSVNDDEEDGSRPISFVPIKPKTPLSRPPPAVEHGSSQASNDEGVTKFSSSTRPPAIAGLPPQPHLPTNAIPTLCDGAVLTCCLRSEVTYDCFKAQGCPNPTSPDNPCDGNLVLRVIDKKHNGQQT